VEGNDNVLNFPVPYQIYTCRSGHVVSGVRVGDREMSGTTSAAPEDPCPGVQTQGAAQTQSRERTAGSSPFPSAEGQVKRWQRVQVENRRTSSTISAKNQAMVQTQVVCRAPGRASCVG